MGMLVTITPTDGQLNSRLIKGRQIFEQRAYLDIGAAFPLPFTLPVPDATSGYPAGDYELSPNCFRTNQYGQLEIDRFSLSLSPLTGIAGETVNQASGEISPPQAKKAS